MADVVAHQVAGGHAEMPAGVGVVGDRGDAVGRQVAAADVEDLVLHRPRHPRIDAEADDVVELPPGIVDLADVGRAQLDVLQSEVGDRRLPLFHLTGREINAEKAALGQFVGQGDQVAARGAAQFQHPATGQRRRIHSKQHGQGLQPPRMRIGYRIARIRHLIVAVRGRVGHHISPAAGSGPRNAERRPYFLCFWQRGGLVIFFNSRGRQA